MDFIEEQTKILTDFLTKHNIKFTLSKSRTKTTYIEVKGYRIRISDHPDAYYRNVKRRIVNISNSKLRDFSNPSFLSTKDFLNYLGFTDT